MSAHSVEPVSRVVSLEEAFLHPRVWDVFPDSLQRRYRHLHDQLTDIPERIQLMDAAGIDLQVLSHAAPGVQLLPDSDADLAIAICREVNDWLAETVRSHPTRLAGFALLPTQSPAEAAAELQRCVTVLGLKGALINGHTHGRYLDHPSFDRLLSTAAELDVPIYLHPTDPPASITDVYYQPYSALIPSWGWPVETGTHLLRLICGGVFDRHPNLTVVLGHLGELLPYCYSRLNAGLTDKMGALVPRDGMRNTNNAAFYFKNNVFLTSSGVFDQPILDCAAAMIGVDRLMFAVDYPFQDNHTAMRFLHHSTLSQADKERFAHGNADRVLRLERQ